MLGYKRHRTIKKAGAELCQAQVKQGGIVGAKVEVEIVVEVGFQLLAG